MGREKTFEEEFVGRVKNSKLGGFVDYFVRETYGAAIAPFRIPTVVRREKEGVSLATRDDHRDIMMILPNNYLVGAVVGFFVGMGMHGYGISQILNETQSDNFVPAIAYGGALAIGNALSAAFEVGRKFRGDEKSSLESQTV